MENASEIFRVKVLRVCNTMNQLHRQLLGFIYYTAVALHYRATVFYYPCCFLSCTAFVFV